MARFWVYIGDKVQGPVDIPSLRKVPGFNLLSQVCQEGEQTWRMADEVIEIKSYFISPPRPNSFAIDAGNTAPKLELDTKPSFEEMTLPEPNTSWQTPSILAKSGSPELEIILAEDPIKKIPASMPAVSAGAVPAGNTALRALCEVCGYKNPRDVSVCMKCGENLKASSASSAPKEMTAPHPIPLPQGEGGRRGDPGEAKPTPLSTSPSPIAAAPPASTQDPATNAMVEISMGKLLMGCAVACALAGGSFFGYRAWKKHHVTTHIPKTATENTVIPESTPAHSPARSSKVRRSKAVGHSARRPVPSYTGDAAALPGLERKAPRQEPRETAEPKTEAASYRVVAEATPLKKRFSSPINSPYAVKRRANQGLWNSQEDHAIQQVQRNRIYGGQRTLERNVEILMQVLRDREYTTAFESGHRIRLYNDLDWSASLNEGPVYDVRLTFSGGRETDGSPKKPLHFAFLADLERGTVEPGGQDQIRSNTLHAFFDESRIAPEERRAIAKDTEELVLAAQPGASPLALDTVVRQFAKVYTTAALTRVADAYDLTLIKKKLAHDTRLGTDDPIPAKSVEPAEPAAATMFGGQVVQPLKSESKSSSAKSSESAKRSEMAFAPSKSGAADFRMETGAGRERTFLVRAASHASIGKIWEVLTGYDRLKQFMPDMLASEREGQDGAATIVHTVCLTRFMIFMFKLNLHLRVIEHPREHTLEFERIAGEFESFRGSVELTTDPATHDSLIAFHATVVPSGRMMNWTLEKMARRLLIPQIEAIRAKAEAN